MRLRVTAPLAFRIATHSKPRLLASVGAIGFAILLMFVQLGFRNALLDSGVALLRALDADLIMTSADKRHISAHEPFPRRRISEARAVPGVASGAPLYIASHPWKNRRTGVQRPIRVFAFEPHDRVFAADAVTAAGPALALADAAIVDTKSLPSYGPLDAGPAELGRRPVRVVGSFALGADFDADGNVIIGAESFFRLGQKPGERPASLDRRERRQDQVEVGLLKVSPGADPESVARAVRDRLPRDVNIATKAEAIEIETAYLEDSAAISTVFGVGVVMGFVVGVVICYQILFTDVSDHASEFATMKAIGYGNGDLVAVVCVDALIHAVLAFAPSVVVAALVYRLLAGATGLTFSLTLARGSTVLVLTLIMCVVSAALSVGKVRGSDPAEMFG